MDGSLRWHRYTSVYAADFSKMQGIVASLQVEGQVACYVLGAVSGPLWLHGLGKLVLQDRLSLARLRNVSTHLSPSRWQLPDGGHADPVLSGLRC